MDTGKGLSPATLLLHRVEEGVVTLGPAPAAAIWVAGCPLACHGCSAPDTWNAQTGSRAHVDDVADWLHQLPTRSLSISGGEPAEQAVALTALIDGLRKRDPAWIVTVFSGYALTELQARPPAAALLQRVDLLKAGRYVESEHESLLWRGSRNQRLHDLTGRAPLPEADRSAGVEVRQDADGDQIVLGVPPVPGFSALIAAAAADRGLALPPSRRPRTFPFPTTEVA